MEGGRRGFSLVELAIVLTIIGIIMSIGIKSCMSGITTARIEKTKDQLDTLSAFIERKLCKLGNFTMVEKEIPENLKKDGWGEEIKICPDNNLTKKHICALQTAHTTVKAYDGKTFKNVAIVLISKGENKKLDSTNCSQNMEIKQDDLYKIITLYQLKSLCCKRKKLKIITLFLPPIVQGESYNVTVAAKTEFLPYNCTFLIGNETISSSNCSLSLSPNKTENITSNEIKVKLIVKDNKGNIAEKTYYVTVIKRKLK